MDLQGKAGKVCAESLNETDPQQAETILRNLGSSICQVNQEPWQLNLSGKSRTLVAQSVR